MKKLNASEWLIITSVVLTATGMQPHIWSIPIVLVNAFILYLARWAAYYEGKKHGDD